MIFDFLHERLVSDAIIFFKLKLIWDTRRDEIISNRKSLKMLNGDLQKLKVHFMFSQALADVKKEVSDALLSQPERSSL